MKSFRQCHRNAVMGRICGLLVLVAVAQFATFFRCETSTKSTANLRIKSRFGKQKNSLPGTPNLKYSYSEYSNITVTVPRHSEIKLNISYRAMKHMSMSNAENKSLQFLLKRGIIEQASDQVTVDTKVILWYIPTRFHPVLSGLHPLRGCPDAPSQITTNRYYYNQSDALIFTAQLVKLEPPTKLSNQVWILHNHESSRDSWVNKPLSLYTPSWRSKFNWTLDYRSDADIYSPYGIFKNKDGVFRKRQVVPARNYEAVLSTKNKTVAWMVSNCRSMSRRMEYVKELKKYVDVDIFGSCGTEKCKRSYDITCLEHISKYYKFYLSFENAFCKDYITEKFFRYFNSDVILIVRGGGNYSRVAPLGTYINSGEFKSFKELADYITLLNEDDEKYLDMLRKKGQYQSLFEEWPIVRNGKIQYMTYHYDSEAMCEVYNRMWNTHNYEKHYNDIGEWFNKGLCYAPSDL